MRTQEGMTRIKIQMSPTAPIVGQTASIFQRLPDPACYDETHVSFASHTNSPTYHRPAPGHRPVDRRLPAVGGNHGLRAGRIETADRETCKGKSPAARRNAVRL